MPSSTFLNVEVMPKNNKLNINDNHKFTLLGIFG